MMKKITCAGLLLVVVFGLQSLRAADIPGTTVGNGKPPADKAAAEETYLEQARRLIDALTSKSKELTSESKEWLKEDFKRMGDWEYKQEWVPAKDVEKLTKVLNKEGEERCDCFWIYPRGEKVHLFFKRPAISYTQKVLTADLLRLLNAAGEK